jgi:hypothetical protein
MNTQITKTNPKKSKKYTKQAMAGALLSILFEILGFICFYHVFGLISLGCLIYSFGNLPNTEPKSKGAVIAIQVVSVVIFIVELYMVLKLAY